MKGGLAMQRNSKNQNNREKLTIKGMAVLVYNR